MKDTQNESSSVSEKDAPIPEKNTFRSRIQPLLQKEFPLKKKLFLSALVGFTISFTFFFFGTLDIFVTNHQEIPLEFMDVLLTALVTFLAGGLAVSGILLIFPGKSFSFVLSLALGQLLASYFQGFFFTLNMGELTGDRFPWEKHWLYALVNTLFWLILLVAPLMMRRLNRDVWRKGIVFSCVLMLGMQSVTLGVNVSSSTAMDYTALDVYLSVEGEYELSEQRNVFVFVVDRLDYNYVNEVRKDDPAFFDKLDGFTDFTNATALYCRTYPSATYMMTGIKSIYDKPPGDYFNEAWNRSTYISLLRQNNYTTKYHTEYGYTYDNMNQLIGRADNLKTGRKTPQWLKISADFARLSVYRYSPFSFKPSFWVDKLNFSSGITTEDPNRTLDMVTDNDPLFYQRLTQNGLTVQNEKNNFAHIHLGGSHGPFTMDENAKFAPETDLVRQTKGAFHILYTYMEEMKKLGLYENATIIITGDHGKSTDTTPLDYASTIGFFVKPSGHAGTPLVQNSAPVSHENLWPTILKSEGFDPTPYGVSAFDVPANSDVVRHFYYHLDLHDQNKHVLEHFEIRGNAKDFSNWRKVEDIPIVSLF